MTTAPAVELDWGVASRPLAGQTESGDRSIAARTAAGAFVAVVDGLGHGPAAAAAAAQAITVLGSYDGEPLPALVERCHAALRRTRGAALTVARIDCAAGSLTWLAVGDVDAVLWPADGVGDHQRRRRRVIARGGVVGSHLPELRETQAPIGPDDLLVLATDGVSAEFARARPPGAPEQAAGALLSRFATGADDALVLAVSYREGPR